MTPDYQETYYLSEKEMTKWPAKRTTSIPTTNGSGISDKESFIKLDANMHTREASWGSIHPTPQCMCRDPEVAQMFAVNPSWVCMVFKMTMVQFDVKSQNLPTISWSSLNQSILEPKTQAISPLLDGMSE